MLLKYKLFSDTNILFYLLNSCGRDKVVILWDLLSKKQLKTVALYESLEAMVLLPEEGFFLHGSKHKSGGTHVIPDGKACVAVGGEKGNCMIFYIYSIY